MASESIADDSSPNLDRCTHAIYSSILGKVSWTTGERPDVAFAVKELAKKASAPTEQDWCRMKRLVRYIRGTTDLALRLDSGKSDVEVIVDASWGNANDRRSSAGALI